MYRTEELANFLKEIYAEGSIKSMSQALAIFYELAFGCNSKEILWEGDLKNARKVAVARKPPKATNISFDMRPIFELAHTVITEAGGIEHVSDQMISDMVRTLLGTDLGFRNADCAKLPHMKFQTWPAGTTLKNCSKWRLLLYRPKEEILRDGGEPWSDSIDLTQDRSNRKDTYRNSLLSTWMQELQRRLDNMIAEHRKSAPLEFQEKKVHGVKVKLMNMLMGMTPRGGLLLKDREKLSGESISKSRKRILTKAGIPSNITPKHLRAGCGNMYNFLAIQESGWMKEEQLQILMRHRVGSDTTDENYIATRLDDDVRERWEKLTKAEKKKVKTHSCFTRV